MPWTSVTRLLGLELVRDRPARGPADEAQPLLQGDRVDLVDHAVDVIGQLEPGGRQLGVILDQLLGRAAEPRARVDLEAQLPEPLEKRVIAARDGRIGLTPAVGKEPQPAPGRDPAVELAQGAGAGVARVHEGGLARFLPARVQRLEVGMLHVDLAPHLQDGRRVVGDAGAGGCRGWCGRWV